MQLDVCKNILVCTIFIGCIYFVVYRRGIACSRPLLSVFNLRFNKLLTSGPAGLLQFARLSYVFLLVQQQFCPLHGEPYQLSLSEQLAIGRDNNKIRLHKRACLCNTGISSLFCRQGRPLCYSYTTLHCTVLSLPRSNTTIHPHVSQAMIHSNILQKYKIFSTS